MRQKTFASGLRIFLAAVGIAGVACSSSAPTRPIPLPSTDAAAGGGPAEVPNIPGIGGTFDVAPSQSPDVGYMPPDAGPGNEAGGGDGSGGKLDAAGDAYIRADGGPFGIAARPQNQT